MGSIEQEPLDEVRAEDAAGDDIESIDLGEAPNIADFTPYELRSIVFAGQSADVGLDGLFNTFRMGERWADLKPGDPLLFMVKYTSPDVHGFKELPRLGKVMRVETGSLSDMLQLHLGINVAGLDGLNPPDARATLKAILEMSYEQEFDGSELCTVIYLYRDPE